jgi:glycosyltransferase involved in cell wall biosynthesis
MADLNVSIVLNMHREAPYLRPTLLSLNACAYEAKNAGINTELIAVFDRADQNTLDVFNQTDLKSFEKIKTISTDVGSLGLARNSGIKVAEGEFVWTADGDDLVSRNALVKLMHTAKTTANQKIAVFVDFWVAFGEPYHVARYFGSEWLTAADFAYQHSFVSRIFTRKSSLIELPYRDLKLTTGFAYEDWELNCRLLAHGHDFLIAPDTVIFYRQRPNGLLKQANSISARLIPHNSLFDFNYYRQLMAASITSSNSSEYFISRRNKLYSRDFARELLESPTMQSHILEAAQIDPEVEPQRIESAPSYCPVPWGTQHWGYQLESLYNLIGTQGFTDVVLLPWLKPGGAEKYILQILDELRNQGTATKILVITGQEAKTHEWIHRLPGKSIFIDLFNSFPSISQLDRVSMIVRAILALTDPGARIHIKPCEFSHEVMDRFGAALSSHMRVFYYRFSDSTIKWDGAKIRNSWGIKHLRNQWQYIDALISDCKHMAKEDEAIIGMSTLKHHTIYAKCDIGHVKKTNMESPKHRLLWASRICQSKRPELLILISNFLASTELVVEIDIYGNLDQPYTESTIDAKGLRYCGAYNDFNCMPIDRYDGLIYTSEFDGMPNVILEAMAAGLPVIAPAIGGIPETVINGKTGFLLDNHVSDEIMAERYVQAIERIYTNWLPWTNMSENAMSLISSRHSQALHAESISKTFNTNI